MQHNNPEHYGTTGANNIEHMEYDDITRATGAFGAMV